MNNENNAPTPLTEARDQFVSQWGVMGSAWGVNRTMAQIHALLITAPAALSTDHIMQDLKISRGNAHSNLRDLVSWGLVRSVVRKGERKEFFEAEKDVWKMFCIIIRERRRREMRPAQAVLKECLSKQRLCGALKQSLSTNSSKISAIFLSSLTASSRKLRSQNKARWCPGP